MSTTPNQKDLLAKKIDLEGILKPDANDILHLPDITITLAESGQFYLAGISKKLLTLIGNTSGNAVALDGDAGLTFTTSGGSSTITGITSSSGNSASLAASQSMVSAKQDALTAGTNITISNNTISATDTNTLSDLTDTAISSLADGQVLKYNATSGKWVNGTGGGGAEVILGTIAPTAAQGSNGNLYIQYDDTNNNTVTHEYVKISGAWEEIAIGGGGSSVIANPSGIATDSLSSIEIDGTIYSIEGGSGSASAEEMTLAEYSELTEQQKNDGTIRFIPENPYGITTDVDMSTITNLSESLVTVTPSVDEIEIDFDHNVSTDIGGTFYISAPVDVTNYDYIKYDLTTGVCYNSLHSDTNPLRNLGIGLCRTAPSSMQYCPNVDWTVSNIYDVNDINSTFTDEIIDVSALTGQYYFVMAFVAWEATIGNLKLATAGGYLSQIKYMDKTYGIGSRGEGYTEEVIYSATPTTDAPNTLTLTRPYTDFDILLFNLYRSADGVMNKYDRVILTSKLSLNDRIQLITYNEWASYDITTTTTLTLINSNSMYIGSVVGLKFGTGGGGNGSNVIPNPTGTPTDTLNTVSVDGTIYEIQGGADLPNNYTVTADSLKIKNEAPSTGVDWIIEDDTDYFDSAASITVSTRVYQKTNAVPALGGVYTLYASGDTWTTVMFTSTDATAVAYSGNADPFGSFTYLGHTWYFSGTNYALSGDHSLEVSGARYIGDFSQYDYSTKECCIEAAKRLIDYAGVSFEENNFTTISRPSTGYIIAGGGSASDFSDATFKVTKQGDIYSKGNLLEDIFQKKSQELTSSQYENLTLAEKTNGTIYFISDPVPGVRQLISRVSVADSHISASSSASGYPPWAAFNGEDSGGRRNPANNTIWIPENGDTTPWIQYHFDNSYYLTKASLHIYSHYSSDGTGYQGNLYILGSNDGTNWDNISITGEAVTINTGPSATSDSGSGLATVVQFDFNLNNSQQYEYIRFQGDEAWNVYYGIACDFDDIYVYGTDQDSPVQKIYYMGKCYTNTGGSGSGNPELEETALLTTPITAEGTYTLLDNIEDYDFVSFVSGISYEADIRLLAVSDMLNMLDNNLIINCAGTAGRWFNITALSGTSITITKYSETIIQSIMGYKYKGGGSNTNVAELTQSEYNALPDGEKNNGYIYMVSSQTPIIEELTEAQTSTSTAVTASSYMYDTNLNQYHYPWCAFNRVSPNPNEMAYPTPGVTTQTCWVPNVSQDGSNSWICYHFDRAYKMTSMTINSFTDYSSSATKSMIIEGSNDGTTWTNILSTGNSFSLNSDLHTLTTNNVNLNSDTAYEYVRLRSLEPMGASYQPSVFIDEIFVYGYKSEETLKKIYYMGTEYGNTGGGGGSSSSHAYSTTEHIVGTWIDGSDIYEKSFEVTITQNSPIIEQDASYIDALISYDAVVKNTLGYISGVGMDASGWAFALHRNPSAQLLLYGNLSEAIGGKAYVTIRYTKVTQGQN